MAGISGIEAAARRWWTKSADEAAAGVAATLNILQQRTRSRVAALVTQARLYGNLSVWGVTGFTYQQLRVAIQQPVPNRITFNVCQSCVDTIVSKMAKNRPKPWYQTSKGDYGVQRKAKKLNDFTTGIFYEQRAYALGLEALRDSCVWGDGWIYVGKRGQGKNARVHSERVTTSELHVDEWEGLRGRPRQMTRVMLMDRGVAMEAWPGARKVIEQANRAEAVASTYYPSVSDLIEVRQSWHLRSGPDAKDGKTIITVPGGANGPGGALTPLMDWPHDFFPFARLPWSTKPIGFWGQGLVEQLEGIQLEINKLLRLCQRSHDLGGSFKMLIPAGSKVVTEHLRAEIGVEVHYAGPNKPEYILPPHVPPEVYEEIQQKKQDAYQQSGVSQLDAVSQKPAGVDSGKALRAYDDIAADRFRTSEQRWQDFFCGPAPQPWGDPFPPLAHLYIETAKEIAKDNGGHYQVTYPGKKFLEQMDWKDIDLQADEYQSQCFPISALSQEPAERLQDVQDLAQAGLIPQWAIADLLDYPDLAKFESLQNSQKDYLTEILEKIIDGDGSDEHYTPPDPYDNLALAQQLAIQYYAEGKLKGLDEPRLAQLRRFILQCQGLQARALPAPPIPPAPGTQPTPQGQAPAAPVSPLMPQAA